MINIERINEMKMPKILVIGVGGAGNNAINRMAQSKSKAEYIAINTDNQALMDIECDKHLQIGARQTGGFGAGADPKIGEQSAIESEEDIRELVSDADMVIITCGMGGGTGSGATPIIAEICKKENILTVGIVTLPFEFEGEPRCNIAQAGVNKLKENVDTLLVIPNDKLLRLSERRFKVSEAFVMADTVLRYSIEGITNIIFNKGVVNLDFNDLKTTLMNKGTGHLGIGRVSSDGPIMEAVMEAVNSPLLETSITGATNLLINSSGDVDLMELNDAIKHVKELAGPGVNIIWGTVTDEEQEDEIIITLIATGMKEEKSRTGNEDNSIVNRNEIENGISEKLNHTPLPVLPIEKKFVIPTPKKANTPVAAPKAKVVPQTKPMHIEIPDFLKDKAVVLPNENNK